MFFGRGIGSIRQPPKLSEAERLAALRCAEVAIAADDDPLAISGRSFWELALDACLYDFPRVLAFLLDQDIVLSHSFSGYNENDGEVCLQEAVRSGAVNCVSLLIGVNVNHVFTEHGAATTPLYQAVFRGQIASCRQLIDAGAAVNARISSADWDGTALDFAASHGSLGITALLLQRGADPNAADSNLETPIIRACMHDHLLIVRALLPFSNLAHRDSAGYSLLHRAAGKGHAAMLPEILPHYVRDGAVDIPTQQPVDAEESACTRGITPLMVACEDACFANTKLLLQAGASRYVKDENKYSALHHCILGRSLACLQLILGDASKLHYAPEQLNEVDARGGTALHMAIVCGSFDQCKLLLAAGADPLALLCGNRTCVDVARSQWPDRLELAALFHPEEHVPLVPLCCAGCQTSCMKLSPCSTCHGVRYCSKACQRAHWRKHKPVCALLPARMQTTMVPLSPTLHKS
jgi:ankyrin repeat protein